MFWLFPPPLTKAALAKGIAIKDIVSAADGKPLWSAAAFQHFIELALGASTIAGEGASQPQAIDLPSSVRTTDVWQVAGVRIDPGAPGLSPATVAEFGQSPQIRLILHPVTIATDGTLTVHDIAAHLIFSFELQPPVRDPTKPDCLPKIRPNFPAFQPVVAGAAALRE